MAEYFSQGASAIAFGANVFREEWLEKRDYSSIEKSIRGYVGVLKTRRGL